MLKTRVVTALLLLMGLTAFLFFSTPLYFKGVLAGVIALGAWEWAGLIRHTRVIDRIYYILFVLLGIYFAQYLPIVVLFSLAFLLWCWAAVSVCVYASSLHSGGWQVPGVQAVAGFIFLVSLWWSLVYLRWSAPEAGLVRVTLPLLVIFSTDIGAYFVGKHWGVKRFIAAVSPNKTWMGFWGGMVFALLVSVLCAFFLALSWKKALWLCGLALSVSIFSVVGDLMVSLLKRFSGVKDTGYLLPGHGGILDRLDSVSAGVLVFSFGILLSDM